MRRASVALPRLLLATTFSLVLSAGAARADSDGNAAAAESLFQDARKLMDAKKYGEACPKFLASHKASPAVGTLLNLADCYEKDGKLASAWARFHEAVGLAQRLGRADREKTARDRADKLEPKLVKLTIKAAEKDIVVKLDGTAIDAAALGTPVPVDPGSHTIEASAKGKKTYTSTFEVAEKPRNPSVDIPTLLTDPAAENARPEAPTSKKEEAAPLAVSTNNGGLQRTLGIVAVGVGVVGLGVGTVFGLKTSSTWSDAQTHCNAGECDQTGVDLASSAKSSGNIATIAFVAGGVFTLGGLALYFTAPRDEKPPSRADTRVRPSIGFGTVSVGGRF